MHSLFTHTYTHILWRRVRHFKYNRKQKVLKLFIKEYFPFTIAIKLCFEDGLYFVYNNMFLQHVPNLIIFSVKFSFLVTVCITNIATDDLNQQP